MSRAPKDFYDIPTEGGVLRLPRVTSICKAVGDKEKLVAWVARTEKEAALNAAIEQFGAIPPDQRYGTSVIEFSTMLRERVGTGRSNEAVSEGAKLIGNEAHKRLEWAVQGRVGPEPPVGPEAAIAVAEGERFLLERGVTELMSEAVVYSTKHGFAGTLDLFALVEGGRGGPVPQKTVIDWKTSKAIYPEAKLQLGGYAIALDEMGHGPVERAMVVRLPKTTEDPGFEVVEIAGQELADVKAAFLHALGIWNWLFGQNVAYARRAA